MTHHKKPNELLATGTITSSCLKGVFSPELIEQLSKEWKIPINFMFIASPGNKFYYKVSEPSGVRLII